MKVIHKKRDFGSPADVPVAVQAVVAVLMGSISDEHAAEECKKYFEYFNIPFETHVLSAHRNPKETAEFAEKAEENGFQIIIGIAGMAAHLAGVIAAHTKLPVIGVPMPGSHLNGIDALYSVVQMPKGVPVATVAIGLAGAGNAAILCAQILALNNSDIREKLTEFKNQGCKL